MASKHWSRIEAEYGKPIRDVLLELASTGLSQAQVADRLGVPAGTVPGWYRDLQINPQRLAQQKAAEELSA